MNVAFGRDDVARMGRSPGKFIVLEGGEGCGKSTQAQILADSLTAVLTREPGGTALGERIRSLVLDSVGGPNQPTPPSGEDAIDPRAETLLMLAARAQHVATVISPALVEGRHVVCDRFSGSTLAYQGFGRGLNLGRLTDLSAWAAADLAPDLVVLLEVGPQEAQNRRTSRAEAVVAIPDRLELELDDFHTRVNRGFSLLCRDDQEHWIAVDGNGDRQTVADRVAQAVSERLGL